MKFALTVLGVSGAVPAHGRFPSAQVLQVQQHYYLIDCGEGAQMRLTACHISRQRIGHIFISHLHGDHIFGLPGLIFSMALDDRKAPLHIYSPPGLEAMMLAQLSPGITPGDAFPFSLHFHTILTERSELIFENADLTVHTLPLLHRIPTSGFLFREKKRPLNVRPEKIAEHQLSIPQIKAAKTGQHVLLENGNLLKNSELTLEPPPPRSFAYVSDTLYKEDLVPLIEGVDLLYHEATFAHELIENAQLTLHTTARQAAEMARKARVGTLIIGHFSSRYEDAEVLGREAREIFPETETGAEGREYDVPYRGAR